VNRLYSLARNPFANGSHWRPSQYLSNSQDTQKEEWISEAKHCKIADVAWLSAKTRKEKEKKNRRRAMEGESAMPAAGVRRSRRSRGAILFCVFLLAISPVRSFASPEEEAQREAALEIRLALSRAADAEAREKLCLRLIEECPQTEDAEEACWMLSNLYLDSFDEPKEDEARKILERFLALYPSSLWAPHAESRLLWLRGENEKR
jgi:hypothetical protein